MRLILMGPPGAGKGTQARLLQERYGLAHISIGNLMRAQQEAETDMGKQAAMTNEGHLAPESIVSQLVIREIGQHQRFVLDGVPRIKANLEWLYQELPLDTVDAIILLQVKPDILRDRIAERYQLTKRSDDQPLHFERRYQTYIEQTQPIADDYRNQGKLTEIDGEKSITEVAASIALALPSRSVLWGLKNGAQPCA